MTTDPDPDFPLYKAEVPCGNGVGRPSFRAPADRVNSSGRRRQSISIVGETAPNIGSDGSSEEDGDVKRPVPNSESGNELQARIDAMVHEKERLTAEYEVEVQQCADLRDALEEREAALANAQSDVDTQLQEAHTILEGIQREEDATRMQVEDEIGHGVRLLEAQDEAIATLELQLHEKQKGYETLKSGALPTQDTDIEAALKTADREMSELLASVQRREETISCLNNDLRHAIEYMIAANVESAGGPQPELSREDFLPARVREHLGLSHWGETHLSILFKKYELIMSELKESPFQPDSIVRPSDAGNKLAGGLRRMAHPIPKTSARGGVGSRAEALQGGHGRHWGSSQSASAANQTRMWSLSETRQVPTFPDRSLDGGRPSWDASPRGEEDTLVAAGPEEGDSDVWAAASEDGDADAVTPLPVGATATESAAEGAKFEGPRSASFAEESGMLREAMAQELLHLADTLAPAADSTNVYSSEPACELMRAAAQGDEAAVRRWLPRVPAAGSTGKEPFLGWTVWHVAAAYGQCGVLDLLKEDTFQKGGHHFAVLNRRTRMGLPPLGVACVTGRVEAARSLIMGMAPVDVRDVRGNTPLLWAAAGGQACALVPLLLDARADAEASNYSGQQPDVASFSGSGPSAHKLAKRNEKTLTTNASTEKLGEAFHLVRAGGSQVAAAPEPGLMSMAVGLLRTPSRDSVGFSRNTSAWASAQLSGEERNEGVWSEWVTNYTHGGLLAALEVGNPSADPTATHRSQQALVLTSERLLLFHAKSWSLTQVVALSELSELTISSFSVSVVIIRMHRLPDIVLDIAACARGRLLDELQRAAGAVAATWGGADFGDSLVVRHSADPIVELYDERRNCVGTLAYVEADIFLLLPYAPNSMLLQGGDTFFFGLLDLHQGNEGAQPGQAWRWHSCFAMVKSSPGNGRRLVWCSHPNDEHCLGSVPLACIQAVQPLDTPRGEHCFVLDCRADGDRSACALTFRTGSAQTREDWVVSVRTVQQAAVR